MMSPSIRRRLIRWLVLAALTYALILAVMATFQRSMLFPRDPARADITRAAIEGLEEVELKTDDGEALLAWHLPPREGRPVLVYFHGNAGNLERGIRLRRFRILAGEGYGLLAVSYRGYGGSSGTPTEAGLHADARAAYAEAVGRYGAERIVVYGESLGTGVAVRLASERPVRAVVLEAPYTATVDVAAGIYPFLPVRLLMLDQFPSRDWIGRVSAPVLILHGGQDIVIPVAHGERLYAMAGPPKKLALFAAAGHEDLHLMGATEAMNSFISAVFAGTLPPETILRR